MYICIFLDVEDGDVSLGTLTKSFHPGPVFPPFNGSTRTKEAHVALVQKQVSEKLQTVVLKDSVNGLMNLGSKVLELKVICSHVNDFPEFTDNIDKYF